jgi:hypothetical protein
VTPNPAEASHACTYDDESLLLLSRILSSCRQQAALRSQYTALLAKSTNYNSTTPEEGGRGQAAAPPSVSQYLYEWAIHAEEVLSCVTGEGEGKGREVVVGLGREVEGLNGDIEKEEEAEGGVKGMVEALNSCINRVSLALDSIQEEEGRNDEVERSGRDFKGSSRGERGRGDI